MAKKKKVVENKVEEPVVKESVEVAEEQPLTYSQNCIDMIKQFEGCVLSTYQCTSGVNTIGYGTTRINDKPVPLNFKITEETALELLIEDVKKITKHILDLVKVKLTQNQLDALISFTYNVGIGAFERSTLLRLLNTGDYSGASNQLLRWTKSSGIEREGLVIRRNKEKELFETK